MKLYSDTHNKDLKAYILYADAENILYNDSDCTDGVTATEILGMFATGILVFDDGVYTSATVLTAATAGTAYATLTVGASSFYTVEKAD